MKILCVTHSSRPFFEPRCTLNALEIRFPPERLDDLPPFESLDPLSKAIPYSGSVTFWEIVGEKGALELKLLRHYDPGYKIQTVAFVGERLVVHGADRIEILTPGFAVENIFHHPLLACGHTVYPASGSGDDFWVSSAPANAALRLDVKSGELLERRDVPETYGKGYPVSEDTDFYAHYIPTDYQATHLNSALPCGDDLLVTLWIPGVVGFLGPEGEWREVVSGYRGCHGARLIQGKDIMLTDSAAGLVWFLDPESGSVRRRMDFNSRWLHDAEYLGDGLVAGTVCDENVIRFVEQNSGEIVLEEDCHRFGESVMFVNAYEVSGAWSETIADTNAEQAINTRPVHVSGENLLVDEVAFLPRTVGATAEGATNKEQKTPAGIEGPSINGNVYFLPAGRYVLEGQGLNRSGKLKFDLRDDDTWRLLASLEFRQEEEQQEIFELDSWQRVWAGFSWQGNDAHGGGGFQIKEVSLRADLDGSGNASPAAMENVISDIFELSSHSGILQATDSSQTMGFRTSGPVRSEYLFTGPTISLHEGHYVLGGKALCRTGAVVVGFIDMQNDEWVIQTLFNKARFSSCQDFSLSRKAELQFVISTANHNPAPVEAFFENIFLFKVD
jgi:hypothetical protein